MLTRNIDGNRRSKSTDSALSSMSDKSCRILKDFLSIKCKPSMNQNFSTPCFLNNENDKSFSEKTSLLKSKLNQREEILGKYHQQIQQINHHLFLLEKSFKEDSTSSLHSLPHCYSSLYALELL